MVYNSLYDFKRSIVLLCFLAISALQHAIGQENALKFHIVEGASGINLGKVNAIAQDSDGFIWFSDQSLRSIIRYDGHSMLRYSYDQNEPNSLGGFYPECLFIDSSGIIWIGFYGQGLDRFDPHTNTFKHFDHDPNDLGSLINNTVSAVLCDSKGNIWVGTDAGISVLDQNTGKFIHYTHNPDDPKSLSHNIVRSLYEDKQGTIWIGTGFAFSLDGLGGLNRFNPSDSSFTRYMNDPENPASIADNKVRAIFEDSKGNFWIGTGGEDGLQTMDRATGNFRRYSYNSKNPYALSRGPLTNIWDHVTFITEDSENQIWIGTESSGVRRYDPETKRTEHYINTSESGIIAGFEDLSGWSALTTSDGLIWMTTQQSTLYKVDLFNTVIDQVVVTMSGANSFIDDSLGNVWLASSDGLIRTDKMGTILEEYSHDDQSPTSINNNTVWDIIKDSRGYIWAATSAGVNRFDSDSKSFKRYLADLNVNDILYDGDSSLWIATTTQGVYALNVYNEEIVHFGYDAQNLNTISGNLARSLEMDASGNIYIGNGNGDGISKINISSGSVKRLLSGISAYWLKKDKNNTIWACTPNGLYVKDQDGADFVQLVEMYPDVDISSWTKSIVEDEEGNLWVGAADGLYKINAQRNHLIRFGKGNGIIGASDELLSNAHVGVTGLIYFTSPIGYFVFDPQKIRQFDDDTQLFFTDMWVNGNLIEKKKKFELGKNSSDIQPIILKHNENLIGLRFSVTDFRAGGNQAIKYKLDKYDGEWRQALSGERVNYYNLPPGDYNFFIKTKKNINGQIVQKSLDFSIAKPWWTRWWAYMLFAFILISGIYAIIKYRTRKLLKEKQILEEKVNERTTDLNRSLNDLKATQAQLIQSEKMASLGELTAGIAHEIQNPLNFVNNFSEVNKELLDELEEEITNGDFEEVKSIAKDLKANEEKINHHGKRADAIVKGMLQHSRTSTGEKVPTDINELADEYLRLAFHGLRAKDSEFNASFDTDLDPELPKIKVIPQDIGRVLLNLINNAFQAVYEKSKAKIDGYAPKVSVITSADNDKIEITIIDNGSGIPDEIKDKIFQPFFTTKPTGQGTGLGLSLSYDIVKAHGGTLTLESEDDEGTQFNITLSIG